MIEAVAARRIAQANVRRAISGASLPSQVFTAVWDGYLFFDPVEMFSRRFVAVAKEVMEAEKSHVLCLRDLDIAEHRPDDASIFIDPTTTEDDFRALLRREFAPRMDTFAAASDVGEWCIYCERANEIAVVGLTGDQRDRLVTAFAKLGALPIERALADPPCWGLEPRVMSPSMGAGLLANYR